MNVNYATAHRLDRVTSGLNILCKNKSIAQNMADIIKNRNVNKFYLAFCHKQIHAYMHITPAIFFLLFRQNKFWFYFSVLFF